MYDDDGEFKVALSEIVEIFKLEQCNADNEEIDIHDIYISTMDINRPGLQLTNFFHAFDVLRIQVIGFTEHEYLDQVSEEHKDTVFDKYFSQGFPCLVVCRGLVVDEQLLKYANKYNIPVFVTERTTSDFSSEIIRWLKVELAPRVTTHGVLVDIYGEGILITGESGIGKSETALELIQRGHRLVADDAVEIKRVSQDTLIGQSPDVLRYFIELRGIGVIDVKAMYGVGSVMATQSINLVIKLEHWNSDKEYNRLGLNDEYIEILGNQVLCHSIPVRPGRNLAIICESAAINHRQKKMGYNAAEVFVARAEQKIQQDLMQRQKRKKNS